MKTDGDEALGVMRAICHFANVSTRKKKEEVNRAFSLETVIVPAVGLTARLSIRSSRRSRDTWVVLIFGLNFGLLLQNTALFSLSFSASHPPRISSSF